MEKKALNSQIVVISWWSNCLGLASLRRLSQLTHNRKVNVVQVGKSAAQRQLFREHLPAGVSELTYPEDAPAEHSRVIREVCLRLLASVEGVWLIDHDVFMKTDCEAWFRAADDWLSSMDACLCLPLRPPTPAITQPAFWLSPRRWPASMTFLRPHPVPGARCFAPTRTCTATTATCACRLRIRWWRRATSSKRTGKVAFFPFNPQDAADSPLPAFPSHSHLGGLFLLAGPVHPPAFESWPPAREWTIKTVNGLAQFFETCPAEWLAIEEPVLLQRLEEFREDLHV